ncbi:MAG: hypothetical protein AAF891_12110 [Pseudomonadota bacterium]
MTPAVRRGAVAILAILCLQHPLAAQEFVTAPGQLNDEDFYRIVACAAPPGGTCQKQMIRWRQNALTVGITRLDPAFLGGKKKRADVALDLAIDEINAAGAGIRLVRDDVDPDIPLLFLDMPARSTLRDTGIDVLDGTPISAAGVRVFARDGVILKSVILVTRGLEKRAYESVILEEITQGLGLMTDIGGTFYESRSIFSQSSNALKKLGLQDRMALGRHYPAR